MCVTLGQGRRTERAVAALGCGWVTFTAAGWGGRAGDQCFDGARRDAAADEWTGLLTCKVARPLTDSRSRMRECFGFNQQIWLTSLPTAGLIGKVYSSLSCII